MKVNYNYYEEVKYRFKKRERKTEKQQKEFIDFSTNRNYLLEKCHGLSKYILLMDANAELINADIVATLGSFSFHDLFKSKSKQDRVV